MGSIQIAASVQNDGNFSHLDLLDPSTGLLKRIEVFRCSQPLGPYGVTGAGTPVTTLAGADHLTSRSNLIHRSIYSEGQAPSRTPVLLELREEMNPPGLPEGSWDVRFRDLDARSRTFGHVLHILVHPDGGPAAASYEVSYELRMQEVTPVLIPSPLGKPIAELVPALHDLGTIPMGRMKLRAACRGVIGPKTTRSELDRLFEPFYELEQDRDQDVWRDNIDRFLVFGNLGPKSVHPAVNLIGEHPDLVADYIVWRKYRVGMTLAARAVSKEMSRATTTTRGPLTPGVNDTKPGVYSLYVMAYKLDIVVDQLVLDKVYSDYGGVPMELKPGSRIETGRQPLADATRAVRTMADIAEAYYLRA